MAQIKPRLLMEARSYLGGCKVCRNCGAARHPRRRKCINAACGGTLYRHESTVEASARLNAYEAEQMRIEAALKEFMP